MLNGVAGALTFLLITGSAPAYAQEHTGRMQEQRMLSQSEPRYQGRGVTVEPYSPEFRRALKDAHVGLRDVDIDRLEALTARRAQLQPDDGIIENIDGQIDDLLRNKMPNFNRVAREYAAKQHAERNSRVAPKIEVKPKR